MLSCSYCALSVSHQRKAILVGNSLEGAVGDHLVRGLVYAFHKVGALAEAYAVLLICKLDAVYYLKVGITVPSPTIAFAIT